MKNIYPCYRTYTHMRFKILKIYQLSSVDLGNNVS